MWTLAECFSPFLRQNGHSKTCTFAAKNAFSQRKKAFSQRKKCILQVCNRSGASRQHEPRALLEEAVKLLQDPPGGALPAPLRNHVADLREATSARANRGEGRVPLFARNAENAWFAIVADEKARCLSSLARFCENACFSISTSCAWTRCPMCSV